MSVGIGAPSVKKSFVSQRHRVGVTADDLRHADVVESGNAARVRLIDVVAQTKLTVSVVTPTENLGWERAPTC